MSPEPRSSSDLTASLPGIISGSSLSQASIHARMRALRGLMWPPVILTYPYTPAMPAETPSINVQRIDHVTLIVNSVDASRRFYVGLLGMTEVPRPAFDFDGAWFQAGATLIHLIQEHDRSGPAGYPDDVVQKSSRNHHFAFEVADARTAAETLKTMGIKLISDAKTRPDGAVQVFLADPDGHVVELCTSKP